MLDGELLHRLCRLYGIQTGYHDLAGHFRHASPETQNALLKSFGVPIHSPARARQHLQARERDTNRSLPHTIIVRRAENGGIDIQPNGLLDSAVPWRVTLEDGTKIDGETGETGTIRLPPEMPFGYHRLVLQPGDAHAVKSTLVVAPASARRLEDKTRWWGLTVPLYGLRSSRNWGIGDFDDLAELARRAARHGAAFIGINPVHALFPLAPDMYSPYSPSSREFLNVMHVAPDKIPELADTQAGGQYLQELSTGTTLKTARNTDHVAYDRVYALKLDAFAAAFDIFGKYAGQHPRKRAFERFLKKKGKALWQHCLYEALAEYLGNEGQPLYNWQAWERQFHRPGSTACKQFEATHRDRIRFYAYLQWVAADQLEQAQQAALEAGMPIGLYLDLAVGMVPGGAEAWTNQTSIASGMSLGAPGDDANPDGQKWHLSPLNPAALKKSGFAIFRKTLQGLMTSAGMVRIDHILGANRSFWAPLHSDEEGGYVAYPLADLLAIIALESHRNNCLVVGEDLGMVPEGFRQTLQEYGLMGCSLFLFERYPDGSFKQPHDYCPTRLASLSNHDFPTMRGFLEGEDLKWRQALGIGAASDRLAAAHEKRETDRFRIRAMLGDAGLLAQGASAPQDQIVALHRFLSRTTATLIAIQIEDLLGQKEQMNVPGTTTEQPNWRRKLSHPIETIFTEKSVLDILAAAAENRKGGAWPTGANRHDHQDR